MKLTPYIRFIVGGLYAINFLITALTTFFNNPLDSFSWVSELFAGLVATLYLTYCIKQGLMELQDDNVELPYPRILATLIEAFNVMAFIFILTQINVSQIVSVLPNLIIIGGMAYLFIQNVRILMGKR